MKSVAVVLGAYILATLLVLVADPLLTVLFPGEFATGHVPSNAALLASTASFIVISVLCAFLCARFAPGRPGRHVLWFFILGEAMGIISVFLNWSKPWPHWYWMSWLLSWPVSCYIGLLIAERRKSGRLEKAAA